jgi:hypothetical protein
MAPPDESKNAPDSNVVTSRLQDVAKILNLRENFLLDLFADPDDWSFVIKAHAFLESVTCTLLAMYLRRQELESVLAEKVEMHARIEMTKVLGITTSEDRRMMHALGTLRNRLVHNAKDTAFTFTDYLQNRDAKRNFCEAFGHHWPDPILNSDPPNSRADYVANRPKFAVFGSVLKVGMYVDTEAKKIQTELAVQGLHRAADQTARQPPSEQGGDAQ